MSSPAHGYWRTTTFVAGLRRTGFVAHKVAGVREAIRAAKTGPMHLPAYSPDLNPIEQAFAKLKAGLRKAGARTRNALWSTIASLLDTFTEPECRNYLANAGYALD